jgi:hypothetical protein
MKNSDNTLSQKAWESRIHDIKIASYFAKKRKFADYQTSLGALEPKHQS